MALSALFIRNLKALIEPVSFQISAPTSLITHVLPPSSRCMSPVSSLQHQRNQFHLVLIPVQASHLKFLRGAPRSSWGFVLSTQQRGNSCQQRSCDSLCPLLVAPHWSWSWHPSAAPSILLVKPWRHFSSTSWTSTDSPFPPCLMDLSKGIPEIPVSWKQISYLPPICSLKIASANIVRSLLHIQRTSDDTQLKSTLSCSRRHESDGSGNFSRTSAFLESQNYVFRPNSCLFSPRSFINSNSSKIVRHPQHHLANTLCTQIPLVCPSSLSIIFFFGLWTMMSLSPVSTSSLFSPVYLISKCLLDFVQSSSPRNSFQNLRWDTINSHRFPIWERRPALHDYWHSQFWFLTTFVCSSLSSAFFFPLLKFSLRFYSLFLILILIHRVCFQQLLPFLLVTRFALFSQYSFVASSLFLLDLLHYLHDFLALYILLSLVNSLSRHFSSQILLCLVMLFRILQHLGTSSSRRFEFKCSGRRANSSKYLQCWCRPWGPLYLPGRPSAFFQIRLHLLLFSGLHLFKTQLFSYLQPSFVATLHRYITGQWSVRFWVLQFLAKMLLVSHLKGTAM